MSKVAIILLVILVLAIPFGAGVYYIGYQRTLGVATANVDTSVTRQTNQYVTTQQQALMQKLEDWKRLDSEASKSADPAPLRAQQKAIVSSMRVVAVTLSADRIPPEVAAFLATHQ